MLLLPGSVCILWCLIFVTNVKGILLFCPTNVIWECPFYCYGELLALSLAGYGLTNLLVCSCLTRSTAVSLETKQISLLFPGKISLKLTSRYFKSPSSWPSDINLALPNFPSVFYFLPLVSFQCETLVESAFLKHVRCLHLYFSYSRRLLLM